MRIADREELWPRLEKLGESKVKEMLASNKFEAHEEEEVQEWLNRKSVISTAKGARIAKIAALVAAVAAIIGAAASLWNAVCK